MALNAGTRLGPYEVTALIGEGGMGQVYRTRDTKLNREVALKILPEAFALVPERLARFKREAQVLASLNHPNIAAIYGFEESDGMQALVLELVEGPTLADLIGLMAASIAVGEEGQTLDSRAPVPLFLTRLAGGGGLPSGFLSKAQYAVAADGRFLMNVAVEGETAPPITVVFNWDAALKK